MPTNAAVVAPNASIENLLPETLAFAKNPDRFVVAAFAAIAFVVLIGLAAFLPLSGDLSALPFG